MAPKILLIHFDYYCIHSITKNPIKIFDTDQKYLAIKTLQKKAQL